MGFSNKYFFALLCVKLTVCGPVTNLVQSYEKGVNHDCKAFPIPKNDTALFELCNLPVPDIKDEKQVNLDLKFSPVPLMCYSAMSNMMTLCPAVASHELNSTQKIDIDLNSVSVGNFCVEAAKVSVKHCEEVPKEDKSDCELLTKVSTILTNKKKCEKQCIDEEDKEIHPVCLYLYFSTQAVSYNFYEKKSENVVLKSTEKSVNPEIPLPPIQPKETKSSTTESQKKPDVKVTNGEKQDVDKGITKGVDEKVEEEVKKEDTNTNKANPTNLKPDGDISQKPGEATTAKNAGEKNGHAEPQTKVEKTDEVEKEPTLPVEAPNKTKPEQGGGGVEQFEYAEAIPEHHEGHPFSGHKDSYSGISENTMKKDKSKSEDDSRSSFFSYFILLSIVAIVAYLVFHNKQKILALILEGRRRQGTRRRSGGREYRKLDSNLEDTMNTESFTSGQHVIY